MKVRQEFLPSTGKLRNADSRSGDRLLVARGRELPSPTDKSKLFMLASNAARARDDYSVAQENSTLLQYSPFTDTCTEAWTNFKELNLKPSS